MRHSRPVRAALCAFAILACLPSASWAQAPDLVERLRAGGLVVFFRHGETRSGEGSVSRLPGCEAERNLSDVGRNKVRLVGEAFDRIGANVTEVLSSPFCRARETALIAFGRAETSLAIGSVLGKEVAEDRAAGVLRLMSEPAPGTVRVLVAHYSNFMAAMDVALAEGEAAVLAPPGRPGERPSLVARVTPERWAEIASAADQ